MGQSHAIALALLLAGCGSSSDGGGAAGQGGGSAGAHANAGSGGSSSGGSSSGGSSSGGAGSGGLAGGPGAAGTNGGIGGGPALGIAPYAKHIACSTNANYVVLADGGLYSWGNGAKGATDEIGYFASESPQEVYDLHATVLHLLGLDHKRLTYYYNGIQRRITDVHGNVIQQVLA